MTSLTEQQIAALAPNDKALSNGRSISRNGDFSQLGKSADGTFYQGECRGSGSKPYITSADFSEGATPVLRCTCPSRQLPCKHCLALLFEILTPVFDYRRTVVYAGTGRSERSPAMSTASWRTRSR